MCARRTIWCAHDERVARAGACPAWCGLYLGRHGHATGWSRARCEQVCSLRSGFGMGLCAAWYLPPTAACSACLKALALAGAARGWAA
eukprot:38762-Chlamydomonas_euryale.AAC.4